MHKNKRSAAAALALVKRAFAGVAEDKGAAIMEMTSHGQPAWFATTKTGKRGKQIASFADNHHGDGRLALWLASVPAAQSMMVSQEPALYFVPPYVGARGWVGVMLDVVDEAALRALLAAAYDTVAAPAPPPRSRRG